MKTHARKKWLFAFIFILGLGILLYPNISQIYAQISQYQIIYHYKQQQEKMTEKIKEAELEKLSSYNESLVKSELTYVDPFEENQTNDTATTPKVDQRLGEPIGYIAIPKININIPIYNGTTDYILQRGIGLMENSSMPVGGEGTHAALTGHRGLPQAKLFTDLDKMAVGDVFYIHSVAGTLAYQVQNIETVLPTETESLKIQPDQDLVTLITCTPYMINTHRILVRGVRIKYDPSQEPELMVPPTERIYAQIEENPTTTYIMIVAIVGALGGITFFIWKKRRKGGEHQ